MNTQTHQHTVPSTPAELGRLGEDLAAEHLQQQGIVLLSRNWRCELGELDLVGYQDGGVVVCEVKARSGEEFGSPAEAITDAKARRLRRLANAWLSVHHIGWVSVRFDLVSVLWPKNGPVRLHHLRSVL
ncbi:MULTISPECIES: YraN family protein [Actinoalloteichus]|uniref:UPF0102 protein UA74_08905 n=1 Tax=Actinoalloteichus fjordicus TaxID=1612552 RepID=A0AAC9LBI9_9PSEU|nr:MULTISPECIES: YraN family protein [Actinoalloteichus]APU13845.1 putative endonuclease related to Holliday junction resolvase [Actinoalloteichus fjordicus]APU19791.1 putative endonuclease related to Holliday junction resolvase [Actinoalloteichus sp. GBA129-24]